MTYKEALIAQSQPEEVYIFVVKPKPGPHRSGNRVSVLDLYQIKGGLRLYLLLDLDY